MVLILQVHYKVNNNNCYSTLFLFNLYSSK